MAIGTFVRWGARHGLAARVVRPGAREGDAHARLAVDRSLRADPYPFYDELRSRGPILPGRLALVTAHHHVAAAIFPHENFRVGVPAGMAPPALVRTVAHFRDPEVLGALDPPSLLAINGPDHARLRRLVSRGFGARAVERLHGRVTDIAAELLDGLERDHRPKQPTDLVRSYASALPAPVIADVLGVPRELHPTFLRWGHAIAPTLDIGIGFAPYRRAEAELTSISDLLLAAGFETTVNLLGNAVVALLAHPDQLDVLRADPAGWRNAVEEALRWDSPVQFVGRHQVTDTVVAGVTVPAGRVVAMALGGINPDPAVFADPHRFGVTRPDAREHLCFGGGVHFCLGAALARLEGEVGLRLLFERFPGLQVAGLPRLRPTRVLRGFESLPVDLHARARPGAPGSA